MSETSETAAQAACEAEVEGLGFRDIWEREALDLLHAGWSEAAIQNRLALLRDRGARLPTPERIGVAVAAARQRIEQWKADFVRRAMRQEEEARTALSATS